MADYFQDILPPENTERRPAPPAPAQPVDTGEKSIRNINIARRAPTPAPTLPTLPTKGTKLSNIRLWAIAGMALVVLGTLGLVAMRKTTVTVVPRTHTVVFDNTAPFTAYPESVAASGTLAYTVQTFSFEDSETVAANGTEHVETKASGSITVLNTASAAPMKLLKNTRFETPEGLIYRTPAEIVIPAAKGTTPGSITVTVVADAVGPAYNVGPFTKLTLPGLKGGPSYATVYARSSAAFAGGFSGEKPKTSPEALSKATADIRTRLEQKVRDAFTALPEGATILEDLARTSYTSLPSEPEGEGSVRIREQISVQAPAFSTSALAAVLAQSVSADAARGGIRLVPTESFSAKSADISATTLGSDPIAFTLSGQAQLVWRVDANMLAEALAGHDQGTFETIISGFPFVQEAKARIEPFWSTAFPKDPTRISIIVDEAPKP